MDIHEREWFIQAPWGRICIVAWGSCLYPPVLVCHGERDSAASFRPLIRLLPRNFYYVGMEIPGNGKSDPYPPGMPITLLDLVYTLEVVRRHFRWESFMYMAHSIATTVGRFYNLTHPGRMTRVVELDQITSFLTIPLYRFPEWYDMAYTSYFKKYSVYNSPKEKAPKYTWEQAIQKVSALRGLSAESARETIERWSEPAGNGLIRFTIDQRTKHLIRPPYTPDHIKSLFTSITTPTLGVVADNSIQRGLYKNTTFLLENYNKTYRVQHVKGTHDVHVISPDCMASYIAQFLLYGLDGLDNKAKL